ncbi:MAG: DUF4136 domain-containing protein, partial [Gemmatimonadales bacterium]
CAAILVMAAAPVRAQQVTYDYSRSVDFTGYKTYSWGVSTPTGDAMTDERIVDAIEAQLAASGLVKVAPGAEPDVEVSYTAAVARRLVVTASSTGWAGRPAAAGRWGTASTSQVYTGALGVEIRDARNGTAVWHGIVSRDLDLNANPAKRERNLNKAVEKLFRHYPTRERH